MLVKKTKFLINALDRKRRSETLFHELKCLI